jgi:hypothetical protein
MNNEVMQLYSRKESLLGRLRVLLSSELDLIKTLEMGGEDNLTSSSSLGTGKDSIEIDTVLKNIGNAKST